MSLSLKRLALRFGDQTIRSKLLVSYLLFISIPLLVFSSLSSVAVSRYYEDQIRFSADQSFEQARTFLTSRIGDLVNASDIVYFGTEVQTILTGDRRTYERDFPRQYRDYLALDRFLTSFKDTHDIYRVTLYVPDWFMFADQKVNFDNLDRFRNDAAFARLEATKEKVMWMEEDIIDENNPRNTVRVISLLRKVRNTNRLDEVIGVVKISVSEKTVRNILEKANITRNGAVLLKNAEGSTICSIGEFDPRAAARAAPASAAIRDTYIGGELTWAPLSVSGIGYTVNARGIANTDWTLVTAIPDSEIRYRSVMILRTMAVMMSVIAIAAYIIASFISRSATSRILKLTDAMDRIRKRGLDIELDAEANDEIGKMVRSFNYMVARMRRLVKERYRAGQEVKSAELRALQAQINPHFLYNTLDLINWKAIEKGAPEIAEISRTLADFYNLSLKDGRDIVTVGDELEHVGAYVRIQNQRFGNRIRFIADVSDTMRGFGIPKIVLQPLAENAILHGILEKGAEAAGTLRIAARKEKKVLVLSVEDDGVGISDETIRSVLASGEKADGRRGYGVRNINARIALRYGRGYGLTFKHGEEGGTIVELRLPVNSGRRETHG